MELKEAVIRQNLKTFKALISELFPTRIDALNAMYLDLGDDRLALAPASSFEYFHNAFPGGYLDHVLRVYEFTLETYEMWKRMGLKVDNFSLEELSFAALHHDLGKLGLPGEGRDHYVFNDSKWHRENQGKMYKNNPHNPNIPVTDKGFYLLNHYGVQYSLNEMIGIRCTDGMYEEYNKQYLAGFALETKLRNVMPYILHHADIMAFRFEFERWANHSERFSFDDTIPTSKPKETPKPKSALSTGSTTYDKDVFNQLFGE